MTSSARCEARAHQEFTVGHESSVGGARRAATHLKGRILFFRAFPTRRVLVERGVTGRKREMMREIRRATSTQIVGMGTDAAFKGSWARLERARAAHSKKKATRLCSSANKRRRTRTRHPMGSGLPGESHPLRVLNKRQLVQRVHVLAHGPCSTHVSSEHAWGRYAHR